MPYPPAALFQAGPRYFPAPTCIYSVSRAPPFHLYGGRRSVVRFSHASPPGPARKHMRMRPTMEFHISRSVRDLTGIDDVLFSYTGNVVFANVAASRKLAQQLNLARNAENDPERQMHGGALFAMGLIDELQHALVAAYRKSIDPAVLTAALQWFAAAVGPENLQTLLLQFTAEFPNSATYRGDTTPAQWLAATTDGLLNREAAFEELLLLWLANANPAFAPFRELFEDTSLQTAVPAYKAVTSAFPTFFDTRPKLSPSIGTLLQALLAPIQASPDSLTGQLDYIRTHWVAQLGPELKRALLAIDILREEDIAIWMRFNPAGPDNHRHGAFGTAHEGFEGDEYIGFDEYGEWVIGPDGKRVRRHYAHGYQAPLNEYEAFSTDQAWMPNVVLLAKSTYVWLEQLSQKYLRHIHKLDQVPDEELSLMARRGITGLWLIGLWERSVASRTIKHLRGNTDAVASAYSLKDYQIAEDLGGNGAYENLRDRASRFGLRLASDMVPNHMGIDSPWVIDHPEWFVSRPESPFPSYSFNGPDLSTDPRVEIKIDDHYYDQTDAAVAFRLRHFANNDTRFLYHGNDGTTFAWNDTAQLDYSKADVREHVMQVILHVARLFPIIRFDAAMVLAKRHVQRLWFPLPGAGGSIPSRAEDSMSDDEFNALMPVEFWREVVDRVAAEVPGTLLLAEAFWMLEGYFVRTLGMHRVYNSAFMVMLRDEENAKYRSYLKKTLEFDPDILKRYVNFMSNPDEKTAIAQFGSGDKFFGVSTLMATLPGLPMFGHGQIEGFTEQYGMEYKAAKMQESPNTGLIARFEHEIAPLLRNRRIFAESANFVLYDFWTTNGTVDENVFAYSNNYGGERSLVAYNNTYGSTRGTVHNSAGFMDKGSGDMRQRSIADGLALPWDDSLFVAYRDTTSGLEYLRRAIDVHTHGLTLDLRGFQYVVLLNWRELRSSADKPWDRLFDTLNGGGVASLEDALTRLRLRPLHESMRQALSGDNLYALISGGSSGTLLQHASLVLEQVTAYLENEGEPLRPLRPKVITTASGQPALPGVVEEVVAIGASSIGAISTSASSTGAPSTGASSTGASSNGASSNGAPSTGASSTGAPSTGAPSIGAPPNGTIGTSTAPSITGTGTSAGFSGTNMIGTASTAGISGPTARSIPAQGNALGQPSTDAPRAEGPLYTASGSPAAPFTPAGQFPEGKKPKTYAEIAVPTTIALHASGLVPVSNTPAPNTPVSNTPAPNTPVSNIPTTHTSAHAGTETIPHQYRATLELLLAEVREHFSEDEMPDAPARPQIPGAGHLNPVQRTLPALAWAFLRAVPLDIHSNAHAYAELFDRLQGRHGMAEAAWSIGIEGENAWRAAALTRITLAHNIGSVNTESFWADPDVRWLLAVNESEGDTWFNRELFAALLPWLELDPDTLPLVGVPTETNQAILDRAQAAGYNVARFLHRPGFVDRSHGLLTTEDILQPTS